MSNILDEIVRVSLATAGSALTRQDFKTVALVVADGVGAVSVDTYSQASEVATARGANSEAYKMALTAFAQRPRPARVKVIRAGVALTHTQELTVTANTNGLVTSVSIRKPNGTVVTFSYTVDSDTLAEVATALAALIAADADLGASAAGAVITITGPADGTLYRVVGTTNLGEYEDTTADPGYGTALNTARTIDDGFFGVCIDAGSSAAIQAVATWAEANEKLFGGQTSDAVELTSGGTLGAALRAAARVFTYLVYHAPALAFERLDVAWMSRMLSGFRPGRATWWGKTLANVTRDALTTTQQGFLDGDNINHYDAIAGRNVMRQGKLSGGEWIDTIVGRQALINDLQVDVATSMFDAPKIPQTNGGIETIKNIGDAVFARYAAGKVPFLRPGSIDSSAPDISELEPSDLENRELSGIVWTAKYAGAIHKADLGVTLSVT